MPLPERYIKVYTRSLFIFQLLTGLVLVGVSYKMGWTHWKLIQGGTRTEGVIVGFKEETFGKTGSGTHVTIAFMPIVEFHAGEKLVRFRDWKGRPSGGGINEQVLVLYESNDPSTAMIDRPLWNWLRWAPVFAVGLFLVLVGIRTWFRPPVMFP